jgi:hypothetical protein
MTAKDQMVLIITQAGQLLLSERGADGDLFDPHDFTGLLVGFKVLYYILLLHPFNV